MFPFIKANYRIYASGSRFEAQMSKRTQTKLLQVKLCAATMASLVLCCRVQRTHAERHWMNCRLTVTQMSSKALLGCPSAPVPYPSSGKQLPCYKSCRAPALPSTVLFHLSTFPPPFPFFKQQQHKTQLETKRII